MNKLFETIKLYDGKLFNLFYHNKRMNDARKDLFSSDKIIRLENEINIPDEFANGLFKCKVIYDSEIISIDITRYIRRKIERLVLVYDDNIEYTYKYLDRTELNELKDINAPFDDEEIVIVKNGLITDCSYANLIFLEGENYFTPSMPLLKGTMRQKLLDEKKIIEREISINDIEKYSEIRLVNAMIGVAEPIRKLFK